MSTVTRVAPAAAGRASDEEDITLSDSEDEFDPPPGPDDEYELDGFVVADDDDAGEEAAVPPAGLEVDVGNILPAGTRRTRRATRSIYDDPEFATELVATLLTDVPQDEIAVAIGSDGDSDHEPVAPPGAKRKRARSDVDGDLSDVDGDLSDVDGDFVPAESESDDDLTSDVSDDDED